VLQFSCIIISKWVEEIQQYLKINSATSKGYEEAAEGDSINFSVPNSETRRGRVGKGVAQTLDTGCNQGIIQKTTYGKHQQDCFYDSNGIIGTIPAGTHMKHTTSYENINAL
jgi:DNA (cytosine-5)-methyltransferase 1